jgi:hypothetical protein
VGTLLVVSFVILFVVTGVLAYASYRRHSRAARARSQAALSMLLAEAYDLGEGKQSVSTDDEPGEDTSPA